VKNKLRIVEAENSEEQPASTQNLLVLMKMCGERIPESMMSLCTDPG